MTVLDAPSTTDQYAQQVRDACRDLPPNKRDELLEDLDEHLADVVADLGEDETLAQRLGTPEAYAADLRQSAGYPPAAPGDPSRPGVGHGRLARRVRSLWEESEDHPQGRAIRSYLLDLRPAWWLARAYLVVTGLADITSSDGLNVIPHLFGSSAAGLVAVLTLGWWSVLLGRSTQPDQEPDRRRRRWAVAFNVTAGLCLLVLLAKIDDVRTVYETHEVPADISAPGFLTSAEGDPIKNIYAFSADGKPLDDVLLYDDRGRPIDAVVVWDDEGNEMVPRFPRTKNGTEVKNRYPTQFEVTGPDGLPAPGPGRPNLAVPLIENDAAVTATTAAPKPTTTDVEPPATTTTPATATTGPPKPAG